MQEREKLLALLSDIILIWDFGRRNHIGNNQADGVVRTGSVMEL